MPLEIEKPMLTLPWILFHVALGFAVAQSATLAMLWCVAILIIGIFETIKNNNVNEEAMLWSAYIAAAEVALRACGGAVVWEIGKLGVVIFLGLGLLVSQNEGRRIPIAAIIMFFLLLPGVAFTFSWSNNIREDLTFNISGMVCLIVSMFYFYKRQIRFETLKKFFAYSLLPIIVLSVVLFYRTPRLETIEFSSNAIFATSGGFGPNQVATILGYGWLIVLLMVFLKQKITFNKFLSYGLLVFFFYRSLITFSRGGNVAAILAFACFIVVYTISLREITYMSKSIATLVIVVLLGIGVVYSLDSATGGMFRYRFTGRNSLGEKKEDVTTGRIAILKSEYELFKENPAGVGVGGSRYFRGAKNDDDRSTHNEFGRLLSEHGLFGIGVIIIILLSPLVFSRELLYADNKAFCLLFFVLCVASMMHSGCRTAMPELLYGLAFIYFTPGDDEDPVYWE